MLASGEFDTQGSFCNFSVNDLFLPNKKIILFHFRKLF